jgi:hypothetical protein
MSSDGKAFVDFVLFQPSRLTIEGSGPALFRGSRTQKSSMRPIPTQNQLPERSTRNKIPLPEGIFTGPFTDHLGKS